jgi:hypothetical protein
VTQHVTNTCSHSNRVEGRSQVLAAVEIDFSVSRVVTWREVVRNLRFGITSRNLLLGYSLTLNIIPIGSPETSVLNHLTPRNNLEDGKNELKANYVILYPIR